jgi:hypothetical protein
LQAAGLVEPPEPRLTLSNFIRVLGDQAFVDPSQMEQRVMEQIQARQRAHTDHNECNKQTKDQKKGKRTKKLQEDIAPGFATRHAFELLSVTLRLPLTLKVLPTILDRNQFMAPEIS